MCVCVLLILSGLSGCFGLEKSAKEKLRKHNLVIKPIERQAHEQFFPCPEIELQKREAYPWELKEVGLHSRGCKGMQLAS